MNWKHGDSRSAEYRAWASMRQRCYNIYAPNYKWYGAKGVTVCANWRGSYPAFLADMGRRPSPKHSLEREDRTLPYGPTNCCWATVREQNVNRGGVKLTVARVEELRRRLQSGERAVDLAPEFGIHAVHVRQIKRGAKWPCE